ncbi:MAG: AarF/ABC1/UbiB kinase family protein [Myxococcales bacterium]|jgi:ubiquinone biosynthesis protein|nr:AarF/ABC1/UbiB kinase family protein [Myxococcales bacterium]
MFQAIQEMNRVREIAMLSLRHGLGPTLHREREKLWELLGIEEAVPLHPEAAQRTAPERFRCLLTELGTTFIKFGQILSTRVDLLPRDYLQELSRLQDDVQHEPFEHIRQQVESSFGKPLDELFASFDEVPLASASIAQVHRAVTLDGQEVVVKVQRPHIADTIRADLDLLHKLARMAEAVFQESAIYSPVDLVEAFETSILQELDFEREQDNLTEFHHNHKGRPAIAVPRPFPELSNAIILTMELVRGHKLRESKLSDEAGKKLCEIVVDDAFQQLFVDGLFHGDPHPGNLLALDDGRLGILDLGSVGRLTPQMQENLILLMMAIVLKDADTVARLIYRLASASNERTDLAAFKADIQAAIDKYLTKPNALDQIDTGQLIPELLSLAVQHHVRVPKDYALLFRAAILVEGVARRLDPHLDVEKAILPYAKKMLLSRYDTSDAGTMGLRAMLRLQTLASDVPMQLAQILLDMERGQFKLNLASEDLQQINTSLKGLGVIIFLGFLACGLTIGGFLSISKLDMSVAGVPIAALLSSVAIGLLFGIALAWSLLSGKSFKVNLTRFLNARRRKKQLVQPKAADKGK